MSLSTEEKVFPLIRKRSRWWMEFEKGGRIITRSIRRPKATQSITKFRCSGCVLCQRKGGAYLWGMLKESAFSCEDPLRTVPALREKIVPFCSSLQQPLLRDMLENLSERYEHCPRRGGAHFEHLH
ncbi:hypothetical protein HNY73_007409 [Argiope bruennichi]|uniref:Uncharacterized protein n=1 Tax=Argiope bruennichi TaxID=94029 RepID=A0A8T0FEH3_ARGBR|nr:hypothetical protein HNY73_007409 [Argiope bruennichi]